MFFFLVPLLGNLQKGITLIFMDAKGETTQSPHSVL